MLYNIIINTIYILKMIETQAWNPLDKNKPVCKCFFIFAILN